LLSDYHPKKKKKKKKKNTPRVRGGEVSKRLNKKKKKKRVKNFTTGKKEGERHTFSPSKTCGGKSLSLVAKKEGKGVGFTYLRPRLKMKRKTEYEKFGRRGEESIADVSP